MFSVCLGAGVDVDDACRWTRGRGMLQGTEESLVCLRGQLTTVLAHALEELGFGFHGQKGCVGLLAVNLRFVISGPARR